MFVYKNYIKRLLEKEKTPEIPRYNINFKSFKKVKK